MKTFQSKKALWWSVGVLLLIVGVFAAAVLLPSWSKPYGSDAPDVRVPAMKNVPEQPHAPKLDLEGADE